MQKYALKGPQVEPMASFWASCPYPCPVSLKDLLRRTDCGASTGPHCFPDYPSAAKVVDAELDELEELAELRDDASQLPSTEPHEERLPLSMFLQLRPQPLGAVYNGARATAYPAIATGSELARYFEGETPGLAHRQALNYLIRETNWSPPRQALVWAALDVTIYSALNAAWYYKWISPRTSYRPRPVELRPKLNVLFDRPVDHLGADSLMDIVASGECNRLVRDGDRVAADYRTRCRNPGTPRHPSYPSGHSTYSGAASELLSFFFPDHRRELDFLADNIGLARLWAGIHYRSDHVNGNNLGRQVACLVIEQLRTTGIALMPSGPNVPKKARPDILPPERAELEKEAKAFESACGKHQDTPAPGFYQPQQTKPCIAPGEHPFRRGATHFG